MKYRDLNIVRDDEPQTLIDVAREGSQAVRAAQEAVYLAARALEKAERILGVKLMGNDPLESTRMTLSDLGYTFGGLHSGPTHKEEA